jgi:hypothetical protein
MCKVISKTLAEQIANQHINFPSFQITQFVDKEKVWYVIYASKKYIETGEFSRENYGNSPFIIDKQDGEIYGIPSPIVLHFNLKLWNPEKHGKRCSEQHKEMFIEECIEEYLQTKYGTTPLF